MPTILFSFNRALELCKLVEPCGITRFEEPVYQNDAAAARRPASPHHRFRIAAGQNEGHRFPPSGSSSSTTPSISPNPMSAPSAVTRKRLKSPRWRKRLICRSPTAAAGRITTCICKPRWPTAGASSFTLKCGASATRSTKNRQRRINGWVTLPETPGLGLSRASTRSKSMKKNNAAATKLFGGNSMRRELFFIW